MNSYWKLSRQLIYFRRIPSHVVAATAVASLLLSVGIYYQGLPLYLVVLYALMPWLPILFFEGLWKVKHYHWFAIFAVFTVLQLGHVMEHVVQAGALVMTDATLACPPPVDNLTNAQMAIEAGLRDVTNLPTGMSARIIVQPDAVGQVTYTDAGSWVTGPPACGIFGQLDLEIVHLVWELIGWGLSLVLLLCFPHSKWLWVSIAWASIHTVEHLFISYTFFLDPAYVYEGTRQIWATVADGNIVTAYPVGREAAMLNFYDVAGKFGIAAKNGLIGTFFPALNQIGRAHV